MNAIERFESKVIQEGTDKPNIGELALKEIVKSPDGRRAINFILHMTPYYGSMFTGDPYNDAFLSGQRQVALLLRSFFDKDTLELIEREEL